MVADWNAVDDHHKFMAAEHIWPIDGASVHHPRTAHPPSTSSILPTHQQVHIRSRHRASLALLPSDLSSDQISSSKRMNEFADVTAKKAEAFETVADGRWGRRARLAR